MTLVRTWSSFAVIVMAQSYFCATTACAHTLVLADELTLRANPPAAVCSTDDACGYKRLPLSTSLRVNVAEAIAQDDRSAVVDSKTFNVRKSFSINDLVAYDWSNALSAGIRNVQEVGLRIEQDPGTTSPPSGIRVRLKERVRKELGGWSPTGLNTLLRVRERKKLGVDFLITFH